MAIYDDINTNTKTVAEFSKVEAGIALLKEKYTNLPDVDTDEGYKFIKEGIKDVGGKITKLEKSRQEKKAPFLEAGRVLDSEAKRITVLLKAINEPMKVLKLQRDEREKREKEERIARLQVKVDEIRSHAANIADLNSVALSELIEKVDAIDTSVDYYDLTNQATAARTEVLEVLTTALTQKLGFEKADADRIKAEEQLSRQNRTADIEKRINNLRMTPTNLIGSDSTAIQSKIDSINAFNITEDDFDDRCDEVNDAKQLVVQQLGQMKLMAEMSEQQAKQEQPAQNTAVLPESAPVTVAEEPAPAAIAKEPEPVASSQASVTSVPHFQTPTLRGKPLSEEKCLKVAISSWAKRNSVSPAAVSELNEILSTYNINATELFAAA